MAVRLGAADISYGADGAPDLCVIVWIVVYHPYTSGQYYMLWVYFSGVYSL